MPKRKKQRQQKTPYQTGLIVAAAILGAGAATAILGGILIQNGILPERSIGAVGCIALIAAAAAGTWVLVKNGIKPLGAVGLSAGSVAVFCLLLRLILWRNEPYGNWGGVAAVLLGSLLGLALGVKRRTRLRR